MKTYLVLMTAFSLGIGFGCTTTEEPKKEDVSKSEIIVPNEEKEHHHSESDSISLNDGAKWIVVPDMMRHIRDMESEILRFSEKRDPDLKDYNELALSLQKSSDLLTSNCTMQGKAHDELHKWLLPYLDLLDTFNKSQNKEEALKSYEELRASYKTFNLYFE